MVSIFEDSLLTAGVSTLNHAGLGMARVAAMNTEIQKKSRVNISYHYTWNNVIEKYMENDCNWQTDKRMCYTWQHV